MPNHVAVTTVENAIIYRASVRVQRASLDHCALMFARSEHTEKRVNQSANVKTMVYAIHKPEYVNVQTVCRNGSYLSLFFAIFLIEYILNSRLDW